MSEYLHVEKPLLGQLAALGWESIDQGAGIPHDPSRSLRENFREWVLPDVFRDSLLKLNPWLTDMQVDELASKIARQPSSSLLEANENIQKLLFKVQVDLNEESGEEYPVVMLIDFENPERNQFHAINQFRIDTPGCGKKFIIPDIVLFVNGLPLVVVEAKVADANTANPMHEAYRQLRRYMNARESTKLAGLREGEPKLFHTNHLLIRTCGEKADFGTISSEAEHFYAWKDIYPEENKDYTAPLGVEREQERLIQGLLVPESLLKVLRTCTVFMDTDSGKRIKVVCRYQQYRAACKIVQRLREGKSPTDKSGVVWHTQGSGKSLTMVFTARMIRVSKELEDYKIIMVNDRVDLEEQLTGTAKLIGGKINVIESREAVKEQLATSTSDVNMVMVHKFQTPKVKVSALVAETLKDVLPSAESYGVINDSERVLIMIDEAHRTQGSDMGDNLFEALPNAVRIAFTGTPLITEQHGNRKTNKRFGDYIDKYKLMDAVNDGATLKIVYQGKTAETAIRDKHGFDTKFEDVFRNRSYEEIDAIKKRYGTYGNILEAEKRIEEIAVDLVNHYVDNILPDGFKAQVVCHSKIAALRYQDSIRKALLGRIEKEKSVRKPDAELIQKLEFLKTAVILSSDGTNELAEITVARKEAKRMNAKESFCKGFKFDESGEELTGVAFLIVCDMLLTGFDAPIEQVMYIDKRLTEHNLLQAIARVNRVAKGKQRGYIVDYIGLANNLATALSIYSNEEPEDLQEGLYDLNAELPILEERYRRLIQQLEEMSSGDMGKFLSGGLPQQVESDILQRILIAMEPVKQRADFEVYLKRFLLSLNLVLPAPEANQYKAPAKRLGYLMQMVRQRYKDQSISIADAGNKVKRLINEHLINLGINPKIPPVELFSESFMDHVSVNSRGDSQAKASEMEHAIRKHLKVHLEEDPAFYKSLSEKLEDLIQKHREDWTAQVEALGSLRDEALQGRAEGEDADLELVVFKDFTMQIVFPDSVLSEQESAEVEKLTEEVVKLLRKHICILDFWKKKVEVKNLRGKLDTELMLSKIEAIATNSERMAVELMKLAEKRHHQLIKENE